MQASTGARAEGWAWQRQNTRLRDFTSCTLLAERPRVSTLHSAQPDLFDDTEGLPPGLQVVHDFITPADEAALLALARELPLREAHYKQYTARRRVVTYGSTRDSGAHGLPQHEITALPAPLQALREQLARWLGIAAADFVHVMVSEYARGTPLGWHRDAPDYGLIAGVSLGSAARLRLRPWPPAASNRSELVTLELASRSAYVMRGSARWGWQHSVPPVPALRHSVTLRTLRTLCTAAAR